MPKHHAEPLLQALITRRRFCETGIAVLSSRVLPSKGFAAAMDRSASSSDAPPSLDDLATEWLDCAELAHMPSMHNFHEMAACAPDLVGVNFIPNGHLYKGSGPRWFIYNTLPLCRLSINGQSPDATDCRWFAYQAIRRATSDGIRIVSATRLATEANAVLWRVRLQNTTPQARTVSLSVFCRGILRQRTVHLHSPEHGMEVVYLFFDQPALAPSNASPDEVETHWEVALGPGATHELRFQMLVDTQTQTFAEKTTTSPSWFEAQWTLAKTVWDGRWNAAFTPGNKFFSGNAPLLLATDAAIREIYYRSVLTLLVLLRTNTWSDRVIITSGERGNIVYYWDTSLFSTILALLEPRQLKQQIKYFMEQDPHKDADLRFGPNRPSTPDKLHVADGWDLDGYAANDV